MKQRILYVFVDPFNELTSGVTTYVNTAVAALREVGEVSTVVIAKNKEEDIELFRLRLAREVSSLPKNGLIVEAPETLYTTKYIPLATSIHIRLHGSRQLGRKLQGLALNKNELQSEKIEIERALYISAPSIVAKISSNQLYGCQVNSSAYPNPCPHSILKNNSKSIISAPSYDILFLGRWQEMKGIIYVHALKKEAPSLKIAVACTKKPTRLPRGINWIPIKNSSDREQAIKSAKAIIIPSLFETASMVGLEALLNQRAIVTWNHLGICEYIDKDLLFSANPGSTKELLEATKQALINFSLINPKKFLENADKINLKFKEGWRLLLENKGYYSTMPYPTRTLDLKNDLLSITGEKLSKDKKIMFSRKIKKLIRNPKKFIFDSRFFKSIFDKKTLNHEHFEKKELPLTSSNSFLGNIPKKGPIKIDAPPKKPSGWVTALVYSHDDQDRADVLFSSLTAMKDFSPFSIENLKKIEIDITKEENALSILNRIDVNNKAKFASVSNFIFIDCPTNIITAIRSTGPYIKTILVRTEYSRSYPLECGDFFDAVISAMPEDFEINGLRRFNSFTDIHSLTKMLRKVVQEIGPKSPDMLIPIINCMEYSNECANFEANRFQGIIYINKSVGVGVENFSEYLSEFSKLIVGMMVVESVYMRYRSICEAIELGGSPAELLKQSLYDGVIFDVREIN